MKFWKKTRQLGWKYDNFPLFKLPEKNASKKTFKVGGE
jgi:hypothetical protein